LAVDTYGAQHAGAAPRKITTAFSLIGLCLALEKGFTGVQVQQAHMKLARQSIAWPRLEPPTMQGTLTVLDVMRAEPGPKREETIRRWAASVWKRWENSHPWVRQVIRDYL
jgi:hypothetical protein